MAGLVVADISEAGGEETVKLAEEILGPGKAVFTRTDVSKPADCAEAIAAAERAFGGLHVLFNNAGVMINGDDDAETTEESVWDATFNINVKGVWYGCKYGIPAMRRSGGGSIINTASFVAKVGAATPQVSAASCNRCPSRPDRALTLGRAPARSWRTPRARARCSR